MKTLKLNSTSCYTIDLYALKAYHDAANHDARRDARLRLFHRQQAAVLKDRLSCWSWQTFCRQFRQFPINLRSKQ